jgi:Glucose-6-phosphate 1-dehydrogenase
MAALDAFDFILFGGSGDLAMRKLLPALYYRHRDSGDTSGWHIIGIGRHAMTRDEYVALALEHCRKFVAAKDFVDSAWTAFAGCLDYVQLDAKTAGDYAALAGKLQGCEARTRVFYLATAPSLFTGIAENLGAAGLVTPLSRVVLESRSGAISNRHGRSTITSAASSASARFSASITISARRRYRT